MRLENYRIRRGIWPSNFRPLELFFQPRERRITSQKLFDELLPENELGLALHVATHIPELLALL
jgi:hypothetical protein